MTQGGQDEIRSQPAQEGRPDEKTTIESGDSDGAVGVETLEKSAGAADSSQLVSCVGTPRPKAVDKVAPGLSPELPATLFRTKQQRRKENWHYFSLCFVLFLAGWDSGTLGPLILRIQTFYHASLLLVLRKLLLIFSVTHPFSS